MSSQDSFEGFAAVLVFCAVVSVLNAVFTSPLLTGIVATVGGVGLLGFLWHRFRR